MNFPDPIGKKNDRSVRNRALPVSDNSMTCSVIYSCHRVLISAVPNPGNKVICRFPGFTLQTFV